MCLSNPQSYLSFGLAAALVLASTLPCRAQFAESTARVAMTQKYGVAF